MIRAELFKVVRHRTPWVLLGLLLLALLSVPVFMIRSDSFDVRVGVEGITAVFGSFGALLAPMYGVWFVGGERRQGTLKRVVAVDGRRGHLLLAKAGVASGTMLAGLVVALAVALLALALVAAIHDQSLPLGEVWRPTAAGLFRIAVVAAAGFIASLLLRSDTAAILGTLGVFVVLGPLLAFIPRVGVHTPYAVMEEIAWAIQGVDLTDDRALWLAVVTLSATMGIAAAAGTVRFLTRDV